MFDIFFSFPKCIYHTVFFSPRFILNDRLEFDAYRTDFEALQNGPREAATQSRLNDAKHKFDEHKTKFERLRGDVQIKLKFLEENKVWKSFNYLVYFSVVWLLLKK